MKKTVFRRIIAKTTMLLIPIILVACAAEHVHERGELDDKKVAYVKGLPGWNPLSVIAVTIYRIDGKPVNSKAARYELLPGEHEIKVSCTRETPDHVQRDFVFNILLKAGHSYKPRLDMTRDCHVNYIDETTGKIYTGTEN